MTKVKVPFTCYLCEEIKDRKERGIELGSADFSRCICKICSRKNYCIYGAFEDLNEDSPIIQREDQWKAKSDTFMENCKMKINQWRK